jgi:hypothetical protein
MEERVDLVEVKQQFDELITDFEMNYQKFVDKGNKSAARRARKALSELRKVTVTFRKGIQEEVNTEE